MKHIAFSSRRNLAALHENSGESVSVISTDIFDTLLFRTTRSEQDRIYLGEQLFQNCLQARGFQIRLRDLVRTRQLVQKLTYRALDVGDGRGEVRLTDILAKQFTILNIPTAFLDERIAIEVEIEKTSLYPNMKLVSMLHRLKQQGKRIVATSDTALSKTALQQIVTAHVGPDLIDKIYSSAEESATKRSGQLFAKVAREQLAEYRAISHVGDDYTADDLVPSGLGIATTRLVRPGHFNTVRRLRGGMRVLGRKSRAQIASAFSPRHAARDANTFGREVLGPITLEFTLRIWLYLQQAESTHKPVLLFCARGGLGIREVFAKALAHYGLPLKSPCRDLLVSRLVAARAAVLARSPAAIAELKREFKGQTMAQVANALASRPHHLSFEWEQPFDGEAFLILLHGNSGRAVCEDIRSQHDLFLDHFDAVCGDTDRIILCDTGLYGSTQKMLMAGLPDRPLETIHFARAAYKSQDKTHFGKVVGLMVERDNFSIFDDRSYALRYWQLIEHLFELGAQSVRTFHRTPEGGVASNLDIPDFDSSTQRSFNPMLSGVLAYVDTAPVTPAETLEAAELAWSKLRKAVSRPAAADLSILGSLERSRDFGSSKSFITVNNSCENSTLRGRLTWVKHQLWREGALTSAFPRMGRILVLLFGLALYLHLTVVRKFGFGRKAAATKEAGQPHQPAQPYAAQRPISSTT